MKTENALTCTSWLDGKHDQDIEVNTKLPYVGIYEFFAQGEQADRVINEINIIYNAGNLTPLQACIIWYGNNL